MAKKSDAEQIAEVDALLTLVRSFLVDVAVLALIKAKQQHTGDLGALAEREAALEKKLAKRQLALVQAISAAIKS